MTTSSEGSECPDCHNRNVKWRFNWRGILYAIFCFPCGLFCCFRRRQQFCPTCHCDILKNQDTSRLRTMGYKYKNYQATQPGVTAAESAAYRNAAMTITSSDLRTGPSGSTTSGTHLIPNDDVM